MTDLIYNIVTVLGIFSFIILAGMSYYALKMLTSLRGGLLQQGWRWILMGLIIITFGQVIVFLSRSLVLDSVQQDYTSFFGYVIKIIAACLLLIGLRAQYMIWHPKGRIENVQK